MVRVSGLSGGMGEGVVRVEGWVRVGDGRGSGLSGGMG